jgi:hypothetical protein
MYRFIKNIYTLEIFTLNPTYFFKEATDSVGNSIEKILKIVYNLFKIFVSNFNFKLYINYAILFYNKNELLCCFKENKV